MSSTIANLKFASSLSTLADTSAALDEVVDELGRALPHGADLVVVFATPHHADGFAHIGSAVSTALRPRAMVGATAEGVIGVRREVERQPALVALAASLPGTALRAFSYDPLEFAANLDDPDQLHRVIHLDGAPVKAIVFLADPFTTPMVKLLPAIDACFPSVPLVGGMASGANQPEGNRLLVDDRVLRGAAVGLAIGGPVRIDCTVSQGCRAIGRPLVITRSKRHIIQELGGRSALEVVRETVEALSPEDKTLLESNGLMVGRVINEYKARFGRGDFLIRNLAGVDQQAGYFAVNDAQTRVGQTIQFHLRDQQTAIEDFQLLLEAQKLHGSAAGALLVSCNGRGTRLFNRPDADASIVHDALGDVPLAGFFAAGELGPVGNQNFLHGHTASLMVFRPQHDAEASDHG